MLYLKHLNSKTTFVTVNRRQTKFFGQYWFYSKTTFVTVNQN